MKCEKCQIEMTNLGNLSGVVMTSYPPQWDEVYVCDNCKIKKTVRVQPEYPDPTGGRNLGDYQEISNTI